MLITDQSDCVLRHSYDQSDVFVFLCYNYLAMAATFVERGNDVKIVDQGIKNAWKWDWMQSEFEGEVLGLCFLTVKLFKRAAVITVMAILDIETARFVHKNVNYRIAWDSCAFIQTN